MATQTITLQQFGVDASRLAAALRDPASLRPALKRAELMMVSAVKSNFAASADPDGNPWRPLAFPRPAGGAKPLRDKGLLMASISAVSRPDGVAVGTNLEYAGVHQAGGTIVPRRGKFLAIPLTVAASRAGGPRRFATKLHAVISSRGTGVLVAEDGTAQYALVKSVTIPARPFLGFGSSLLGRLTLMFQEFLGELAGRAR